MRYSAYNRMRDDGVNGRSLKEQCQKNWRPSWGFNTNGV